MFKTAEVTSPTQTVASGNGTNFIISVTPPAGYKAVALQAVGVSDNGLHINWFGVDSNGVVNVSVRNIYTSSLTVSVTARVLFAVD